VSHDPRTRFDVLQQVSSTDGSLEWLRIGIAYKNPDGTIDAYLDVVIDGHRLRLRETQGGDSSKDEVTAPDKESRHGE